MRIDINVPPLRSKQFKAREYRPVVYNGTKYRKECTQKYTTKTERTAPARGYAVARSVA